LNYANQTRAAAGAVTLIWFLTLLSFTNFFGKALQKKYYFVQQRNAVPKRYVAFPMTKLQPIFRPIIIGIYFIICIGLTTFGFIFGGKMKIVVGVISIIVVTLVSLFVFQHVYVLILNDRRHHIVNEIQVLLAIAYTIIASITCCVDQIAFKNDLIATALERSLLISSVIFGILHSFAVGLSMYMFFKFLKAESSSESDALLQDEREQIQGIGQKRATIGGRRSTKAPFTYSSIDEMFEAHGLSTLVPVFHQNDIDLIAFSFMELEDLDLIEYKFTVGQKLKLGALITRGFDDFVMV